MSAPSNWPTDRMVYPEEAFQLAAIGRGFLSVGSARPAAAVTVRDATGRLLRNVIACCEATGQVIQVVTDGKGNILIANCRNEPQRAETFYPAPLQISYERPLNPDHPQPPAAPVPSSTADPATCHRSSDPA